MSTDGRRASLRTVVAHESAAADSSVHDRRVLARLCRLERDSSATPEELMLEESSRRTEVVDDEVESANAGDGGLSPKMRSRRDAKRLASAQSAFDTMWEEEAVRIRGLRPSEVPEVSYISARAGPPVTVPRTFCAACGQFARYKRSRCGDGFCSIACKKVYMEEQFLKS